MVTKLDSTRGQHDSFKVESIDYHHKPTKSYYFSTPVNIGL